MSFIRGQDYFGYKLSVDPFMQAADNAVKLDFRPETLLGIFFGKHFLVFIDYGRFIVYGYAIYKNNMTVVQ